MEVMSASSSGPNSSGDALDPTGLRPAVGELVANYFSSSQEYGLVTTAAARPDSTHADNSDQVEAQLLAQKASRQRALEEAREQAASEGMRTSETTGAG